MTLPNQSAVVEAMARAIHGNPDFWEITHISEKEMYLEQAERALTAALPLIQPTTEAEQRLAEALQIAISHIDHMAKWIGETNCTARYGYSFEGLGGDMPAVRAALAASKESKNGEHIGRRVSKRSGDYQFDGEIVAVIRKRSGELRYALEDDRGLLLIMNAKQCGIEAPPEYGRIHTDGSRSGGQPVSTKPDDLADGWRPIETAPKDGDEFLAYGLLEGAELYEVVSYEPNDSADMIGGLPASEWVWVAPEGACRHISVFTHWQSLPKPPSAEKGAPHRISAEDKDCGIAVERLGATREEVEAEIVAWLRKLAHKREIATLRSAGQLFEAANAIEHGEHRIPPSTKQPER